MCLQISNIHHLFSCWSVKKQFESLYIFADTRVTSEENGRRVNKVFYFTNYKTEMVPSLFQRELSTKDLLAAY